jgi:hypothetical protein
MRKPPKGRRPPQAPADLPVTSTLTEPRAADPRQALEAVGEHLMDRVERMNAEADAMIERYQRRGG